MIGNNYFLDSAKFTWLISSFAFLIFILEELFRIRRNQFLVLIPKFIFYQLFLFEIFLLKYKKHRLSLAPALINISLRNFTVHIVFGLFNYQKYAFIIHLCWYLIDTFKLAHIILDNSITGMLKYAISILLFIIHGFFECMAILGVSFNFILPFRIFGYFVFLIHLVSLQIVLKHKFLQYCWYKKSRRSYKKD